MVIQPSGCSLHDRHAAAIAVTSSGDATPAAAVPAGAPLYLEAVLRPEGQQKQDVEAALRKLLATDDPDAKIAQLFESGDDADVSYAKDVEPWLGQRAGVFFTSFTGDTADGAAVIDSTDDDAARAMLEKTADPGAREQTYKGVDYWSDGDSAQGVVDGYVVAGSPSGFRTVVDTLKGDDVPTLAGDSRFQDALDAVGADDALGTAYVDMRKVVDAVGRSGGVPPQALEQLRQAVAGDGAATVAAKLSADSDALTLESVANGVRSESGGDGDGAAALKSVPGDAWLGIGIGALGSSLEHVLAQIGQVGGLAGGLDLNALLAQVGQASGIDVQKDLLSWMGDAALFVRGSSVVDIGGALVVQSKDPARTRTAVEKLGRFLSGAVSSVRVRPLEGVSGVDRGLSVVPRGEGSSLEVLLAAAGSKFVTAVGRPALEAAVKPDGTLGDSDDFRAAAGKLDGIAPSFFFDVAPVVRLASAFGASSDGGLAQARRYLDHLGAVAGGTETDGDTQRGRLVLTLG
jgi:hypothetical protein